MLSNREAFWCVSCKVSGHASWDRLCLAFLATSKHMEETHPKHSYKYFPSQAAWMWEQQPGYKDNMPVSLRGALNLNGPMHKAWGDMH